MANHLLRTGASLAALVLLTSAARSLAAPVSAEPAVPAPAAATVAPAARDTADSAAAPAAPAGRDPAAPNMLAALERAASSRGLRPHVLRAALAAHARVARRGLTQRRLLTVIDFGLPSRVRRLWVLDLERGTVLARELVAHGRNSGGDVATSFSNREGSNQSSLGTFLTGRTYTGKHGLSLRLRGLDEGVNDNAMARAIVIHGAGYVNRGIVAQLGRLGRSLGCPALAPDVAPRIIDLIRDGTVLFAWHPSAANPARGRAG